jgi:hypothetical protein
LFRSSDKGKKENYFSVENSGFRQKIMIVYFLLILFFLPSFSEGKELLLDGSFESGTTYYWQAEDLESFSIGTPSSGYPVKEGFYAVKVTENNFGFLSQVVSSGINEGNYYTLEGWIYDSSLSGKGKIILEWLDREERKISSRESSFTLNQAEYQRLLIKEAKAPQGAEKAKVKFYIESEGLTTTLYLDKMSFSPFESGGEEVFSTEKMLEIKNSPFYPYLEREPFRARILYRMPPGWQVEKLEIYNLTGYLVRVFPEVEGEEEGYLDWDGRATEGNLLPLGVYLVHLKAFNQEGKRRKISRPIILSREF